MTQKHTALGVLAILLAGLLSMFAGAYVLHSVQQFLFDQGAPGWLAVGIPLAAFLTFAVWAYARTFRLMRRS